MKKIFSCICALSLIVTSVAQKTTGLSPVFKMVSPTEQYERLYGFINESGKLVVPHEYSYASDFVEGFSIVTKNEKYGYVDESGKLVIPCEYDRASDFKNGLAEVVKDDKSFYIDASGKKQDNNTVLKELNQIKVNDRFGFTDKNGELIVPADYKSYSVIGNYLVCRDGEMRYVFDQNGKKMFETSNRISDIENNYVFYHVDAQYGVMDISGNKLFETDKGILKHYSGDYFYSINNSNKIYYDKTGKIIEKPLLNGVNAYIESEIVKGSYYANIYDASRKLIKSYNYNDGVEGDDLKFINGLARLHLMKEDASSKNQLVREWGGVQTVYVNMKGEIVWRSETYYSCFPAYALISMADGSQKKISEIKMGDEILSFDFNSEMEIITTVEKVVIHYGNYDLNEITFVNAEQYSADLSFSLQPEMKMSATPNHPVYTTCGTKTVSSLQEGDKILTLSKNGYPLIGIITSNEKKDKTVPAVYNLKTQDSCYFVNGILVMMK